MRLFLLLSLLLFNQAVIATEIASCHSPSGTAYYPETGLVIKKNSGWSKDKISNGLTKLIKNKNNEYDILFVDATNKINSTVEQGGKILPFARGEFSVSVLTIYPGQTAEIYTFLKTTSGKYEYIHMTSRSGSTALITKASRRSKGKYEL